MSRYENVTIEEVELVEETHKALKVKITNMYIWIPIKLIVDNDLSDIGDIGTIIIPKWFADERGINT